VEVPHASVRIAFEVTGTLAGPVGLVETWRDGVQVENRTVDPDVLHTLGADIAVSCNLVELAEMRAQEVTPLQALARGIGVVGDWPTLMCFAGLIGTPAVVAAWASPARRAEVALARAVAADPAGLGSEATGTVGVGGAG
jgi:hypothetical protein